MLAVTSLLIGLLLSMPILVGWLAWLIGPICRVGLGVEGRLAAFRHRGYWQSMDTIRDKVVLEAEWDSGNPRWKVW